VGPSATGSKPYQALTPKHPLVFDTAGTSSADADSVDRHSPGGSPSDASQVSQPNIPVEEALIEDENEEEPDSAWYEQFDQINDRLVLDLSDLEQSPLNCWQDPVSDNRDPVQKARVSYHCGWTIYWLILHP
jgi:hypothetical protein